MKDLLATIELYDDDDTRVGLNNGSNFNRNPGGVNQFTKSMRTAEEILLKFDPLFKPTRVSSSSYNSIVANKSFICLLYTSPSPRDGLLSRMPSSA